jgi:hypothetical protein
MFVIIFKQHGALNCEQHVFGPFDLYTDAEDALCDGSVPLLYGQGGRAWPAGTGEGQALDHDGHRYIQELEWVEGCIL